MEDRGEGEGSGIPGRPHREPGALCVAPFHPHAQPPHLHVLPDRRTRPTTASPNPVAPHSSSRYPRPIVCFSVTGKVSGRHQRHGGRLGPSQGQEVEEEGDDGQWVSYPPAECAEINGAVQAGRTRVSLGSRYELDLVKMTQTNSVTKYRRNIRKSVCEDAGQGTSGLGIKEEDEEPVTKKRRGGVRKGSKVCKNAGQGMSGIRIKEEEEGEEPVTKKRRGGVRKGDAPEESDSKEVVKTVLMKGKAPVDTECKVKLGKAHVYSEGDDVYDVMLNQTNLQYNNNKFYLIQLLQDDHAQSYSVWMRWGRVGHVGQNKLEPCGDDLAKAKDVFINKFFAKTKNEWTSRENFKKVPGKYDLLFMDYGGSDEVDSTELVSTTSAMKPSQLDVKLQSLMDLICDLKAMEECVLQMKFDTKKAPL
ncbi:poly [ADP-ribose] polymerase 2, partial [Clarias magur]